MLRLPRSLKGQLIALCLLGLLVSQLTSLVFILHDRHSTLTAEWMRYVLQRTVNMTDLIDQTPSELHLKVMRTGTSKLVHFAIKEKAEGQPPNESLDPQLLAQLQDIFGDKADEARITLFEKDGVVSRGEALASEVWHHFASRRFTSEETASGRDERRIYARVYLPLKSGQWLSATVMQRPVPPSVAPLIIQLATMVAFSALAVVLVFDRVLHPLKSLAKAAKALGRGEKYAKLPEQGPKEVVETIRAFNEMQDRLSRFISDRTKMLAAISHDLRTPITSLRLRAEFVEDDEVRLKILETLDEMQQMAEATLAFAREEAAYEETRFVDLAALVTSVCADLADAGSDVVCEEVERLAVRCRPVTLKRAVRNVVENAVSYGQRARVGVERDEREIIIWVDDDGPGIPDGDIEKVFQPFVRLEGSRSRETGGVGLGLAIARSIVRSHGGDIILRNRAGGGLRATLTLPFFVREDHGPSPVKAAAE